MFYSQADNTSFTLPFFAVWRYPKRFTRRFIKHYTKTAAVFFCVACSLVAPAFVSAAEPSKTATQTASVAAPMAAKVNLNSATVEELVAHLSGIGEAKAKAIVEFRQQHGPFRSVEELIEVRGIGEALLAKNRERLTL